MRFTEFYNQSFFSENYTTHKPEGPLKEFIEFYWETSYSAREEFSVKTFPRIGSTILYNTGTPFRIEKEGMSIEVHDPVYYIRDRQLLSYHAPGNRIFGVQFKINLPALFNPGVYADKPVNRIKDVPGSDCFRQFTGEDSFNARVQAFEKLFSSRITKKQEYKAAIVNRVMEFFAGNLEEGFNIRELSGYVCCSVKTVERYFRECVGMTPKKALMIMRARKALDLYLHQPGNFRPHLLGYYDCSHFYKEMKEFASVDNAETGIHYLKCRKKTS